jgi:hypothetical protein
VLSRTSFKVTALSSSSTSLGFVVVDNSPRKRQRSGSLPMCPTISTGRIALTTPRPYVEASVCSTSLDQLRLMLALASGRRAHACRNSRRTLAHTRAG